MTVKVIKKTPSPKVKKKIECDNCGVTLEYVPADIKSYSHSDYSGGSTEYFYILCPECGHKVIIETRG